MLPKFEQSSEISSQLYTAQPHGHFIPHPTLEIQVMNAHDKSKLIVPTLSDILNGLWPDPAPQSQSIPEYPEHETALLVGQASGTTDETRLMHELMKNLSPGYTVLPKLHRFHKFTYGNIVHVNFAAIFPYDKARYLEAHPWPALDGYVVSVNCVHPIPEIESPLITGLDCDAVGIYFTQSTSDQLRPLLVDVTSDVLPSGWSLVSGEKPMRDGDEFPRAYAEILFPPSLPNDDGVDTRLSAIEIAKQIESIALKNRVAGYIYYRVGSSAVEEVLIRIR